MSEEFKCGRFVTMRIGQLLGKDPADLRPNARAMLAQLRQAAPHEPGTIASVWPVTMEELPSLPKWREPRVEYAIHSALTLFAIHQQAQSRPMHVFKQPFGRAVRNLAQLAASGDMEAYETPVYTRFTAMCRTSSMPGLMIHARGLVTQLRGQEIAFDYGQFSNDLEKIQDPRTAEAVRRRWARDFHRLTTNNDSEGTN